MKAGTHSSVSSEVWSRCGNNKSPLCRPAPPPSPYLHTSSYAQPVEGAGAGAGAGGGTIDDSPPPEDDSLFSKFESSDSEGEEESKSG